MTPPVSQDVYAQYYTLTAHSKPIHTLETHITWCAWRFLGHWISSNQFGAWPRTPVVPQRNVKDCIEAIQLQLRRLWAEKALGTWIRSVLNFLEP